MLDTESHTIAFGGGDCRRAGPGDCLALVGDLGAGKTHFTKGIVAGLGCDAAVTSPTFTLVHEYRGGRLPVFHFDFYRLESAAELLAIGWDDYLDEGGVAIVEWADNSPTCSAPTPVVAVHHRARPARAPLTKTSR